MIRKLIDNKIGLALGGGGARGIAHVGVLKALTERNQQVEAVAGTSAGALIATLYAFGVPWERIKDIFASLSITKIGVFNIGSAGLMSGTRVADVVREVIGEVDIAEAKIPLAIVCCDLKTGRNVVFTKGPAPLLVQASGAFPGLFSPVLYQDMVLVDGFLTENVPVSAVRSLGSNFVVGVNLSAEAYTFPDKLGIKDVLNRSFDILVEQPQKSHQKPTYAINLDMSFIDRFKIEEVDRAIAVGYDKTQVLLGRSQIYWITRPIRYYVKGVFKSVRKLVLSLFGKTSLATNKDKKMELQ